MKELVLDIAKALVEIWNLQDFLYFYEKPKSFINVRNKKKWWNHFKAYCFSRRHGKGYRKAGQNS